MKVKRLIVQNYLFRDELGDFLFQNVEILVDAKSNITEESFDQTKNDFMVSSSEIERMNREAGHRFFNRNYQGLLRKERGLSLRELNGIRLFLNVTGTDLSKLIGLDKSTISRMMNGKHDVQNETMILIMEKMKNELETPGITKAILKKLENGNTASFSEMNLSAKVVAEWFVRKFIELEECITNLKLQKLLYYSQGIGIGRYNCKFIVDDFYAWEHGPVVPEVYRQYKSSGSSPLPVDPGLDIRSVTENELATQILNDTINTYGKFSAWILREKTHCESPWLETPQTKLIEFEKMRSFFEDSL